MLTVSDGVAGGSRQDESGQTLEERLTGLGYEVERKTVPDEPAEVREAVAAGVGAHRLVVTSGGTGLGPRDRTPEAIAPLLEYVVPGFGEAMRAAGRRSTPYADLSRSFAGVARTTLVIALPGSPRAALESLGAVEPLLEHALATLSGDTQQHPPPDGSLGHSRPDAPSSQAAGEPGK